MATLTNKCLCSGTLTNGSTTLYTSPNTAGTDYAVVKSLILCNKTAASHTATISFNSVNVIYQHTIEANDTIVIPFADAILENNETITGLADANTSITYYISGIESTG